ncbi:MAG: hypothetical protein ICCCNLDF_00553 [Planctomycetes bacterium]|nr:hypothetical protein [Planctomycetota bacterium]
MEKKRQNDTLTMMLKARILREEITQSGRRVGEMNNHSRSSSTACRQLVNVVIVVAFSCLMLHMVGCRASEGANDVHAVSPELSGAMTDINPPALQQPTGDGHSADPDSGSGPLHAICQDMASALSEGTDMPRKYVHDQPIQLIDTLTVAERAVLVQGLRDELYLTQPNSGFIADINGVARTCNEAQTTNPEGPNFYAYWYVDGSGSQLVRLEKTDRGYLAPTEPFRFEPRD